MVSVYVVALNRHIADLVSAHLATCGVEDVQVVPGGTYSGTISLATSIRMAKRRPVAVVLSTPDDAEWSDIEWLVSCGAPDPHHIVRCDDPEAVFGPGNEHPESATLVGFIATHATPRSRRP